MPASATVAQATKIHPGYPSTAESPLTVHWTHSASVSPSAVTMLDPRERSRLDAFRDGGAARDYLAAHTVARCAIAKKLMIRPEHVVFSRPTNGRRPFVPDSGIHFSLSHSRGLGAVVISDVGPVGIDSEHRERAYSERLFRRILADVETSRALHDAETAAKHFLLTWTRKESILKALGTGLTIDPKELVVTSRAVTLFSGSADEVQLPMRTESFVIEGDHICAVASSAPFTDVNVHRLSSHAFPSTGRPRGEG